MIFGTRGSRLALIQTQITMKKIGVDGEVKVVKTQGDMLKREIKKLGGRAFTRELDEALINNEVDLTVHSMKDIPVEDFPSELEISCVVERGDPRDCLISDKGDLGELPYGTVVGVSSERRKAEILNMRDDLRIKPLRGNVPTRIEKLDKGEYDAIITAKCALDRLGLSSRAAQVFSLDEMVPAAGQGAIAIVKRKNFDFSINKKFKVNLLPCMLERFFISGLGACRNPVGAYCTRKGGEYMLTGLYYSKKTRMVPVFQGTVKEIKRSVERWKEKYT